MYKYNSTKSLNCEIKSDHFYFLFVVETKKNELYDVNSEKKEKIVRVLSFFL